MEKSLGPVFEEIHNSPPDVASSAPGRINIIGEHTDYNQGYVLPAAINMRNYFFLSKRADEKVCIWTENLKKRELFSLKKIYFSKQNKWINYVKGIFWTLQEAGFELRGINGLIWGNIPLEAGLSSSAALEVSIILGLNTLFKLGLAPQRMAEIARKAENDFVGVECGIMDQFVSFFGKEKKAVFLDCETLEYELVPVHLEREDLQILVFESGVHRELASSEYNKRRNESFQALELLKKYGTKSYKQVTLGLLEERKNEMDEALYKRARHVVSENERVKQAVEAMRKDDFLLLGELIFRSHKSLRDDYEVSCPELDLLYESGREFPDCFGARLTGAGFGGSGIALVKQERLAAFRNKLLEEASKRKFPRPEFYEVEIGEGAKAYFLDKEEKR
ncbi:MAG: galactokinase [Candidatus Aminicenantes bacterium]|nr:galactokinase [Candidatus Aminicenantes bacterium]